MPGQFYSKNAIRNQQEGKQAENLMTQAKARTQETRSEEQEFERQERLEYISEQPQTAHVWEREWEDGGMNRREQ